MAPNYRADYSLRYDRQGEKTEINTISPLLTAPEYSIDEVEENMRLRFPIMHEAVRIAHRYKYDMDMIAQLALYIVVYHDSHEYLGLTELMCLFSQADLVGLKGINFGRAVEIEAFYLIGSEKGEVERQAKKRPPL